MRVRLREAVEDTAAFYAERYPDGYQHAVWPDHVERVDETVSFAVRSLPGFRDPWTIADLSCGDGALALALAREFNAGGVFLGDVNESCAPGQLSTTLALPKSVDVLPGRVDLFVCSETLEHLDEPDAFLSRLRLSTDRLLVTTPEGEAGDSNPEHYWGWDSDAVGAMLAAAGFTTVHGQQVFTPKSADVYRFQMWMVS